MNTKTLSNLKWYHFLWELPQLLVGLFLLLFYRIIDGDKLKTEEHQDAIIVRSPHYRYGGISLGRFIFLKQYNYNKKSIAHEYGHCIQSLKLGWLYLIVIGIPSIVHASVHQSLHGPNTRKPKSYYHFYTEKWADELGGVERR